MENNASEREDRSEGILITSSGVSREWLEEEEGTMKAWFHQQQLEHEQSLKRAKRMSSFEPRNNEVALFKNSYKEPGDKKPDMTGSGLVNGKQWDVSAWHNVSQGGKKYIKMRFSEPYGNAKPAPPPTPEYVPGADADPY
jgi:hypothetical protein